MNKKHVVLLGTFLGGLASGMNPIENTEGKSITTTPIEIKQPEVAKAYIPQHYDHTDEFHRESICCFRLRRWVLQPVSVVLQLVSGGLIAGAQYCIKDAPSRAGTYNAIGLGAGVAALVVNMLLLRVDNKLEDMDNYILQRRNSNEQ